MYLFILAAAALALAAILWYTQTSGTRPVQPPSFREEMDMDLHRMLADDPRMVEALAETVQALEGVMKHPELGGPGFLLVQFPLHPAVGGQAVITAQYPNIREGLYRRIVRQELDRDTLTAAGVPEALLSREPAFETESGGMVLLSVQINDLPPEFAESLRGSRERSIALGALTEALGVKLPQFSIRIFGTDLLLTPLREGVEALASISIDE